MSDHTKRQSLLLALVLIFGLLITACGGSDDKKSSDSSDKPLVILEWSGYEATGYPQYFAPFTEKYKDNLDDVVTYSFLGDDSEAYSKMQSGFKADIVHPCTPWWGLYVNAGLVQPIDTARLTNWNGIPEKLRKMGEFDGKQYFVPWDLGYESVLVRTDLVPEMPDSWADLWDRQYKGHVVIWDSAESAYIMGALVLGLDPWSTTPDQDEQIKQKLIELKPNLLTYWTDYTQTYDLPAAGDAWLMGNVWQDAYAYLNDEGYDVAYLTPTEGRMGWMCGYGISADSQNLDLAYEFIDAAIAPESMAAMANDYYYGFANLDALPLIDPEVAALLNITDPEAFMQDAIFYQPITEEQRQRFSDVWNEVKAAP